MFDLSAEVPVKHYCKSNACYYVSILWGKLGAASRVQMKLSLCQLCTKYSDSPLLNHFSEVSSESGATIALGVVVGILAIAVIILAALIIIFKRRQPKGNNFC